MLITQRSNSGPSTLRPVIIVLIADDRAPKIILTDHTQQSGVVPSRARFSAILRAPPPIPMRTLLGFGVSDQSLTQTFNIHKAAPTTTTSTISAVLRAILLLLARLQALAQRPDSARAVRDRSDPQGICSAVRPGQFRDIFRFHFRLDLLQFRN